MVVLNNVGLLFIPQKPASVLKKLLINKFIHKKPLILRLSKSSVCQDFACEAHAQKALMTFEKKFTLTEVVDGQIIEIPRYKKAARPIANQKPDFLTYRIEGTLASLTEPRELKIQPSAASYLL